MKTLEEHNQDRRPMHDMANERSRNGIECPDCKHELMDSNPMVTLTSYPPQKNVHCECGYSGYRIA